MTPGGSSVDLTAPSGDCRVCFPADPLRPPRPRDADPRATDEELLQSVVAGGSDGYADLWLRYRDEARRYASTLVPAADVDDVVSEAFAKILGALRTDHGPRDHPERYLMVAVRSVAITITRRRRRDIDAGTREATERNLAKACEFSAEPSDRVVAAFSGLPPRYRRVLWLIEVEGRTCDDAGTRLGINGVAAASLAYRARRALRCAYGSSAIGADD